MSDSLFDAPTTETPTPEGAAPAPAAPPAAAAPDGYEDPRLKDIAGGKWKKWDDVAKGYSESSKIAREKAEEAKALAEKAQGYEEKLAKVVGAPKAEDGTPMPYTFELPEGVALDPEHPLFAKLNEVGHELDLSPKALEPLVLAYLEHEAGSEVGRREAEAQRLEATLGDKEATTAEIKATFEWASALVGEDAIDDLRESGALAASILTLSRLRKALTGANIGAGQGVSLTGKAAYDAWLARPSHQRATMPAEVAEYLNSMNPDPSAD